MEEATQQLQQSATLISIPDFPEFTKLKLHHKASVDKIVGRFETYADFTFVNLFTWSIGDKTEISFLNGNLVVRFPDYMTGETTYSIIGDTEIDSSIITLMQFTDSLRLVPAVVVENLRNFSEVSIYEDRDSYDYVYDLQTIANLSGSQFKNKRNKLNGFKAEYGDRLTTETIGKIDDGLISELKSVFMQWSKNAQKSASEFGAEKVAVDRLLKNFNDFDLLITIVRIDGRITAFSVHEILENGHAVCHYEKALTTYENSYVHVINQAAKDLIAKGCHTVNWEQDLGLDGLRFAKSSYHPTKFLRKYSIDSRSAIKLKLRQI